METKENRLIFRVILVNVSGAVSIFVVVTCVFPPFKDVSQTVRVLDVRLLNS